VTGTYARERVETRWGSVNGKKNVHTICQELGTEFPEIFDLCVTQTLENNDVDQEMRLPMTEVEKERLKVGISKETITVERIWNKRPDGFTIKKPTKTKTGELVIPEFKRMSCLTDQYVTRTRNVEVAQYTSIKSTTTTV
jgi:hypothetical protein